MRARNGRTKKDIDKPNDGLDKSSSSFVVNFGTFTASAQSARLLERIGGEQRLVQLCTGFYRKAFEDSHLAPFIGEMDADMHGARLALYIAQRMNPNNPLWSEDIAKRDSTDVHSRAGAHSRAWHCPKRSPKSIGRRFKLDDCRVWMRLMMWSAREEELLNDEEFGPFFVRFIGHFIAVYERSAQVFARESARWSISTESIRAYEEGGRRMADVVGIPYNDAVNDLSAEELHSDWPYEGAYDRVEGPNDFD